MLTTGRRPRRALRALACSAALAVGVNGLLPALAQAEWPTQFPYFQKDRGWYFYHEERETPTPSPQPAPEPEEHAPKPDAPDWAEPLRPEDHAGPMSSLPTEGPVLEGYLRQLPDTELAQMLPTVPAAAIRAWIPVLMDQALTRLDRVSVRKYLLVQQESLRRSEQFSRIWQEVIWTDGGFDQPDAMPLGGVAQRAYDAERATREKRDLASLRETVSLLLVVQPNCRSCEIAWKILREWGETYEFTVRPIATELMTLADGTAALPYPLIVESLQVTEFPGLYLLQPRTRSLTRLGTGILTEQEIATRLLRLIPEANPEGAVSHVKPVDVPAAP